MKKTLSKEELNEELCEHCPYTCYGSEMETKQLTIYQSGCEGSCCDEAYAYYLDNLSEREVKESEDNR